MEIPGEGNKAKADRLHEAMAALAPELGVRVTRPVKTCELRIRGLDDSITSEEIEEAVVAIGARSGHAKHSLSLIIQNRETSIFRSPILQGKQESRSGKTLLGVRGITRVKQLNLGQWCCLRASAQAAPWFSVGTDLCSTRV
ncbi:uncharacterized protein LOC109861930 [Pseudomyrmex gracilis]|uniref:uncharacterized protein LOC109861930 n=1 Tax=Pseudomyrmex gracilis TaxID=219809 RepID=UPI000995C0B0|nr:uncharacterized protein LOC109861930 [Pseudomyrmex gracilis]